MSDAHERTILLNAKAKLTEAGRGLPRLRAKFSLPLQILLGLVIVLLFSGCVNIVNLLLARSRAHEHEAAIRAALGSSRARLIAANVTETLLLALAGGLVSLPLAVWGSRLILHWLVTNSELQLEVSVDWTMLAFTAAVTLIAGLLVALLPAWRAATVAVSKSLGQRGEVNPATSRHASRLSAILVAGQLGLSIASLVIAGLLTHTLLNYEHLNIGMDRQHVLSVAIDPSAAGYNNAPKLNHFYRDLIARIDEVPGVISSSLGGCGLMNNGCATVPAVVRGAEKRKGDDSLVERNYVGAKYFSTVGMALLRGREITERDTLHAMPVGVVNTQFERHFLRGNSAIGRIVHAEGRDIQIVGVVENARSDNIHKRALSYLYLPVEQAPEGWNVSHIEIRTRGNPVPLANSVRKVILGINRAIPVTEITTLAEETNRGLASELLVGRLAGVFSALILLVTAVGLYGILAYEVTQRRGEFAVRLALGATRTAILRVVATRAGLIWIAGCVAGLAVSLSVAHLITSLLFDTGTLDLWAYGGALLLLLLISAIAAWLPAWRAASVDPASVLRSE
jgi:predicted permease